MVEALTTEQLPTLAVHEPGRAGRPEGSVTVAETAVGAAPLLLMVNEPETVLPGPVQVNGSATENLTSSVMVSVAVAGAVIRPPTLALKVRLTVSFPSVTPSLTRGMVNVRLVTP